MPLKTTVIGSFPKPKYDVLPDWFQISAEDHSPCSFEQITREYNKLWTQKNGCAHQLEQLLRQATKEVLSLQHDCGIDLITDGEVRRENYVYYFCRHLKGFDFENLSEKSARLGAWKALVPTIVADVEPLDTEPWVYKEWLLSQKFSEKPVKITLPGPLTIINSVANRHYSDKVKLAKTLAHALNREVRALADAGCKHIQIDEPVLVRMPEKALAYGIDNLADCFEGVPEGVEKWVHLCCGYPLYLDQEGYPKADNEAYFKLADKLDNAGFDVISLEDAHRRNDLSLFQHFKKTKIALGVVKIACSHVESVDQIKTRLQEILSVLPAEQLIVAPDCGLAFLPTDLAVKKLRNMVQAAQSLP